MQIGQKIAVIANQTSVIYFNSWTQQSVGHVGNKHAYHYQKLIKDFIEDKQINTTILEDNQSCLKWIESKKSNHRIKHIDTKYHFIKDIEDRKLINFSYCPIEEMTADMLTKTLNKIKLKYFLEKSGLKARNWTHIIVEGGR